MSIGVHPTGFGFDDACLLHDPGKGHPETAERLTAIRKAVQSSGRNETLHLFSPREAQHEDLLRCHTATYLATAKRDIESGAANLRTGDTNVCRESWHAAVRASGLVLEAVDRVVDDGVRNAFCAVRPPGHHAERERGLGFCVVNHVAIAARYAQALHPGVSRVLIVDWDVHHGNGTQDIFYEDDSVFYFSTHQDPWFPGTGARNETGRGEGQGATLNCPFPAGTKGAEVREAFVQELGPRMSDFRPDLVLISAGFDARIGDPLGGFLLTDEDFRWLTEFLMDLAGRYAQGRLVSVLEGGYDRDGLAAAVVAHLGALQEHEGKVPGDG